MVSPSCMALINPQPKLKAKASFVKRCVLTFFIVFNLFFLLITTGSIYLRPTAAMNPDKESTTKGEFVFLIPPQSLAINQMSLAMELYRRGNTVVIVTLEEGRKYFDEQLQFLNRSAIPHNTPEIECLTVGSVPPAPDFEQLQEVLSQTSNISIMSIRHRFDQYIRLLVSTTLDGLDAYKHQNPNHPVLSKNGFEKSFPELSPLYVLPVPVRSAILYLRKYGHSYVYTMPVAAMASRLNFLPYTSIGSNPPFQKSFLQRWASLLVSFYSLISLNFPSTSFMKEIRLDLLYDRPQLKLYHGIPQMSSVQTYSPLTVFTGPVVSTERMNPDSLPPEILHLFNGATHDTDPVVFVSFGTNARLSGDQVEKIVDAFAAKDPTSDRWRTLWALPKPQQLRMSPEYAAKVERLTEEGRFLIVPWVSVPAVLAHPKVKLFVSHCGGSSLNEALVTGVPLFGLPLFGDQSMNCATAKNSMGIAVVHNFRESSVSQLRFAFTNLIHNLELHPIALNARKAKILTTTIYNGIKNSADWLQVAYGIGNDFSSMETVVEREGVVKSYCLDFLAVLLAVLGVFAVAGLRQLCFRMPRRHRDASSSRYKAE